MRIHLAIVTFLTVSSFLAFAGRPIFLSDAEASIAADLIIVADIEMIQNVSALDPFDPDKSVVSESGEAFAKVTTIRQFTVLAGAAPATIFIYGGKRGGMTDFRLEKGGSVLLLKKIGEARYRAVDWDYGLMPIQDGRVEWMLSRSPKRTEWIPVEEAIRRIKEYRTKSKQDDGVNRDKPEK
jgi:hypothetical protein